MSAPESWLGSALEPGGRHSSLRTEENQCFIKPQAEAETEANAANERFKTRNNKPYLILNSNVQLLSTYLKAARLTISIFIP